MSKFAPLSYFDLSELFSKPMFSITKKTNLQKQTNGTYLKSGYSSVYLLHVQTYLDLKVPID